MNTMAESAFNVDVVIRGYHIYKDTWIAIVNQCQTPSTNDSVQQYFYALLYTVVEVCLISYFCMYQELECRNSAYELL